MTPTREPATPTEGIHLQTLGTPALRLPSGSPTREIGLGKPLAVLIYLAAAPGRSASRHAITSLLWADLEPDAARHNLRQALWYVRRKTGNDLVSATGDTLRLIPDVTSDRDELLDASARGDHERVIGQYAGPFVPDFAAPGSNGFEDWCALERRRLLETFRHSADAVVRTCLGQGRARDAITIARKLRDQDAFHEGGWRLLIEACVSADDRLAAKAEAEALQQLALQEELELEPATRATLRTVATLGTASLRSTHDAASPGPLEGSLVGRAATFASLLTAWEIAKGGRLARVHVTARAGIGKTRLLRDFAARLRGMRCKVVAVSGSVGMREISSGLAGELVAGLAALPGKRSLAPRSAATLVELNPSLSTYFDVPARAAPPNDLLRARSLALRELAVAVSFEHPVAVLIDDLHWCDDDSMALLTALADGLREAKVLLVSAGRPEARRTTLVTTEGTEHLELDPLSAGQVEELVLSVASLPALPWTQDFANDLWRASHGSPLLALEQLQLLESRGLLARADGAWTTAQPEVLRAELRAGDVLRARLEDMERSDRWLLTLLAIAGGVLETRDVVEAAERPESDVRVRLRYLETHGFVSVTGDAWQIAHDEIAEALLRLTNAEGMSRGAARVGRALSLAVTHDERRARRAAQLLRQADDAVGRVDLFRQYARHRHALGDRRSVQSLAIDLFGATTDPRHLAAIRAAAPWTWRVGLVSPVRRLVVAAGVAAVTVVAVLGTLFSPSLPPPDAVLAIVLVDSTGEATLQRVELREDAWEPQQPLTATTWDEIAPFTLESTGGFHATWDPQRRLLITSQAVDDDGAMELFAHGAGGAPRRVAPAPGDDQLARLSPDGSRLAFLTGRWDTLSRYDIAIMSLRDSVVTQLTSGPASDLTPVWAPDGDRIAFSRSNWGQRPNELCVASLSMRGLRCQVAGPGATFAPLGWIDADRIVVTHAAAGLVRLAVLQWSSGELTIVSDMGDGAFVTLSEDGRWVFCVCATGAGAGTRPAVFPLAAPRLAREVGLGGTTGVPIAGVWTASQRRPEGIHLRIDSTTAREAPASVPVKLSASVSDTHGRELAYHAPVRWAVSDPSAARIDSITGVLVASGARTMVRVRATAGAIARDSLDIPVTVTPARAVFTEAWADTTMGGWLPFGRPAPVVVALGGSDRRAFLNNGDGSFTSGAMTATAFDARHGLAVDLEVAGEVTRPQWQAVGVDIVQGVDVSGFRRAKGRNITPSLAPSTHLCALGYPAEHATGPDTSLMAARSSAHSTTFPIPDRSWITGSWHTMRVQLLPDGRCGVALDGVPWLLLPAGNPIRGAARVQVLGNSADTRMLVGRIRVSEGVPRDVDWTKARARP